MPLEGAVRTKGIDVELDLASGEVMADPDLFDHALSNVLTNAIRHAGTCVRITYDGTHLSVWNDGVMPDPAQVPRLFDRFHTGEGGSTGIGLAIAKEIAELEGWRISARCVDDGLEIAFDLGGGNA
jgi:signal transduction histidine kinase